MSQDELKNLTIHEARKMLDSRKISSKELTNIFLERIQKVDQSTNAYITVTTEFALQQADIADEKIIEFLKKIHKNFEKFLNFFEKLRKSKIR